jgi:hypothetical protein
VRKKKKKTKRKKKRKKNVQAAMLVVVVVGVAHAADKIRTAPPIRAANAQTLL